MNTKKLQIDHLEARIRQFKASGQLPPLSTGWIRSLRSALGITFRQLGNRLGKTAQSAREMEIREQEGTITLNSLREAARAMDMELVYGFVPIRGTLENHIDAKARALATSIVLRTSNSMKLEDQENSSDRIRKAIEERTSIIKRELPKALWD
jgi:predicted DNA-binding mobile mystery protein A